MRQGWSKQESVDITLAEADDFGQKTRMAKHPSMEKAADNWKGTASSLDTCLKPSARAPDAIETKVVPLPTNS